MRSTIGAAAALLILLGWAGVAAAQAAPAAESKPAPAGAAKPAPAAESRPAPAASPGKPFTEWDLATGDWGGSRTRLREDTGIDVSLRVTADWLRNQRGGIEPHENISLYWVDLSLAFDLSKIGGPEGGRLVASYWQTGQSPFPSPVGAFNAESSLVNDRRMEFAEAYYDQKLVRDHVRLKVGKMDPTEDIAFTVVGADFLNLGVTYPAPLYPAPHYPDSAVGAELLFNRDADRGIFASLVGFDGAKMDGVSTGQHGTKSLFEEPSSLFFAFEGGYRWNDNGRPVSLAAGGWKHTGDFTMFSGNTRHAAYGYYVTLEGQVWKKNRDDAADPRGLYLLGRFSSMPNAVAPIDEQYTAGAVWKGPFNFRKPDSMGVAYTYGDMSEKGNAPYRRNSEQVVEFYYNIQLTPFFSLSPDVQYIGNPGGNEADALVFGVRLVVDF